MKQLYAYFLPLGAAAWILIFLPFSEGAIDYLLVGAGVVLAIAALILKQKEQTASEEQQKLSLAAQLKGLGQIESNIQIVGQAQIAEQQQVRNQINVLQTTMNELKVVIVDTVAQTKLQQEELAKVQKDMLEQYTNKQQEILEAFATKIIEGQQMLANNNIAALDTQTTNLSNSLNELNRPLQGIQGAVENLDERLNFQVKDLIKVVEEIQEGYQPLINQITEYSDLATDFTEQMGTIQSQVITFSQEQLTELAAITENLQLSVSELASSKHAEREQALKVQKKLMEQYEKMS